MVKERRVSRSRVGEFNIEAQENAKGWSQVMHACGVGSRSVGGQIR